MGTNVVQYLLGRMYAGEPVRLPLDKQNAPLLLSTCVKNVHVDRFNQYLCTGKHLQSDLRIFQFDFMFVKPRDVPPLLCANVQTKMRFGVEQLVFTTPTLWKQELFYSKSHFSLHVSAKQHRHIVWFHKHKIELKYV